MQASVQGPDSQFFNARLAVSQSVSQFGVEFNQFHGAPDFHILSLNLCSFKGSLHLGSVSLGKGGSQLQSGSVQFSPVHFSSVQFSSVQFSSVQFSP
eukprot:858266-Pyramimonas_sp.AAC.1